MDIKTETSLKKPIEKSTVPILEELITNKKIGDIAYRLFSFLVSSMQHIHANTYTGTTKEIASRIGCSERSVLYALNELEAEKYISKETETKFCGKDSEDRPIYRNCRRITFINAFREDFKRPMHWV